MEKIAILFGSSTGNTESVAEVIAEKIGGDNVDIVNVAEASVDDLGDYTNFILGTSTWGVGDLQDDWDEFLSDFAGLDFAGKKVAIYGLGDSMTYADSFVDGMKQIYDEISESAEVIGFVDTDGYNFDESTAVVDGKFVGLPLDEDNEDDLTESRIDAWLEDILGKFN